MLPVEWFLAVDPDSGDLFEFNRSHVSRVPFHLLWGLEGFRRMPVAARGVLFVAICVLTLAPRPAGRRSWPGPVGRRYHRWLVSVAGVAAVGLFWLLRVPYGRNIEFGDAWILPGEVEIGMAFAADALTYHVFHAVRSILVVFVPSSGSIGVPPVSGLLAITVTSCLAGGVFVAALVDLARTAGETTRERIVLFAGGALGGYAVMFCGYVETTQVELAAMAVYFAAAARTLRSPVESEPGAPATGSQSEPGARATGSTGERVRWLALALAALAMALMAHAAGLLLLPSAAVLLVGEAARPNTPWRQALRRALSARNAALLGALVVLPYVLVIVIPFFLQGDFGNITGGGDGIMFVPWHFDPAEPASRYVYYSFLSGRHLADLFSSLLVAAPLAVPLCVSGAVLMAFPGKGFRGNGRAPTATADTGVGRHTCCETGLQPVDPAGTEPGRYIWGTGYQPVDRWWLGMLAAAAGGCLLVPVLWNHDFGMWGDWNLAACYLFPLNLFAWSLFTSAARARWTDVARHPQVVVPLVLVQLAFAVGFLLQLW